MEDFFATAVSHFEELNLSHRNEEMALHCLLSTVARDLLLHSCGRTLIIAAELQNTEQSTVRITESKGET